MKNLFLMLLVYGFFSCSPANQNASEAALAALEEKDNYEQIPWVKMEDLEFLQQKKPRKVIVDAYTDWCGPCKLMDKHTFENPEMKNYIGKNFYAVKFNAESPDVIKFNGKEWANPGFKPNRRRNSQHQLASSMGVRDYPTLLILDENLKVIDRISGLRMPPQLKDELNKYL